MGVFRRLYRSELTDNQIKLFWHKLCEAGRERSILYDEPVRNMNEFVSWFRSPSVFPWLILIGNEPAAIVYLTDKKGKTAYSHFTTIPTRARRVFGMPTFVACGLYAVSNLLWERTDSGGFVLDRLMGVIPSHNRAALHLVGRVGYKLVAEIPGLSFFYDSGDNVPGVLITCTRDDVSEKNRRL